MRTSRTNKWREFCTNTESVRENARMNKIIKNLGSHKEKLEAVTREDGSTTNSPMETLQTMAKVHFKEEPDPGPPKDGTAHTNQQPKPEPADLLQKMFNPDRLTKVVKSFGPFKAAGPDGIQPITIQKAWPVIGPTVRRLLQACHKNKYTPIIWREAKAIYLPKPGKTDYNSPKSFRTITLTPILQKIHEKCVKWYIDFDLNMSELSSDRQFGFKKGSSTETALHKVVRCIEKRIAKKGFVMGTFLDIEGAFDNISFEAITRAIKKSPIDDTTAGAPGMDDITPAFLQNLGPVAMAMMLDLFNLSFNTAKLPQSWRTACIIPLLKGGKPASEISSYRPISLTSCMVKALERMVANRIYYLAETQGWLSNYQAGFRKQRNTEDQILRTTQSISDGFQKKPHQRTVMALLDYSKAFDRVWIEDLLNDMLDLGIPMKIMKWVRAFLFNRRAVAQVNNTTSSSVAMRQGLPQGSVLSPLLFLFYINGLEGVIPEGVDKALFADDASVWAQDTDLKRAEQRVQLAVEAIYAWSLKKKMEINVLKSEATFFSNSSKEAQCSPKITLAGTQMPFNDSPKFLGVHLDRTLSFQTHVLYAAGKVSQRCRILASLASKEWGWRKQSLRTVFLATQRSVIDYASPAWQPYISATQMDKLDVAQNKALRLITGHHLSTPREALRIEAGVSSCTTYRDRNAVIAYEKALRLPKGHPRRTLAAKEVPHRTMAKGSWRKCAKDISTSLPTAAEARENFPSPFVRPWAEGPLCPADSRLEIHSYLPGRTINKKKEDMTEKETADLRGLALEVIDNYNAELVTYTDGSCKAGTTDGGAAAVFTTGPAAQPAVLETLREKDRFI